MIDQEALLNDLSTLVRVRSVSGSEEEAVKTFARQLSALGFDEVRIDSLGNLIGILRGARPGGRIIFQGHIDTVPEGELKLWSRDPFGGEIVDGRIWGRGTSDMKAGLVAMAHGLASLRSRREELAGELVLTAVIAEEVFEGVAFARVLDEIEPEIVITGEATELDLAIGQRGRAELSLTVHGKSAHSSSPAAGVNAIRGFNRIFPALEGLDLPRDEFLGPAILEPVDLISEPWPGASVIPAVCRSTWDRRLLPGETEDSVLEPIRALFKELGEEGVEIELVEAEARTWTGETLRARRFFPAWKLPKDHPLVGQALSALEAGGLRPGLRAWGFCTDASESAGRRGILSLGFGPSREDLAHIADEFVEIDQVLSAAKGYRALALGLSPEAARLAH